MSEHPAKDQNFLGKLTGIILANLENENFGVKELVQEAGISRYSLKRRLQAINNKTIKQFIREVRLQKAMEILQNEEVNISDVSYRVGFSSPAYFNTCFHEFFGYPPGTVKKGDYVNNTETDFHPNQKKRNQRTLLLISSGILLIFMLGYLFYMFFYKNSLIKTGSFISKTDKSIAVLPFKNLSDTVNNQYVIDGLMEEIHANLGMIHDLRLISRTSAEKFRNSTGLSIPEIARELRVKYIVEGSGQIYGNQIHLILKLYDAAAKETCLWVKSYKQEIIGTDDLFKITSNIAQSIAEELKTTITPQEKRLIEKIPTTDLSALDFYQRAREEEGKFPYYDLTASSTVLAGLTPTTRQSIERAEKLYRTALSYDSAYALAYTGLAGIYWRKNYHKDYFSENFLDSVLILTEKARTFNNQLPDAYYIRGMYYGEKGNYRQAIQDFDKALDLNPNYWLAYYGKGLISQDYIIAIENLLEAASLNHSPGLADILEKISFRLSETGNSELAKKYSIETIKLRLDSAAYYFWLWMYEFEHQKCLEYYKKRYSSDSTDLTAIEFLSEYFELTGKIKEDLYFHKKFLYRLKIEERKRLNNMQRVGYAYAQNGLMEQANYYFDKQIEYCKEAIQMGLPYGMCTAYYDLAGIYAYRGNKIKACEYLRILNQRDRMYSLWITRYIKLDPLFNGIRNDPAFQKIVKEMDAKYDEEHERMGRWLKEHEIL